MAKKPRANSQRVMGFKAERGLQDQIIRLAVKEERSVSWVIRKLLLQALETQRKEIA